MIAPRTLAAGIAGVVLGSGLTLTLAQEPAKVTKLDGEPAHVAIVVRDLAKTSKYFADVFGVTLPAVRVIKGIPMPPAYGRDATVSGNFLSFSAAGMNFELVQPLEGGKDPWNDILGTADAVVHHIAFRVPDIPQWQATMEFLKSKGGKWTEGNLTDGYGYVDMRPQLGFVIEAVSAKGLVQPAPKK